MTFPSNDPDAVREFLEDIGMKHDAGEPQAPDVSSEQFAGTLRRLNTALDKASLSAKQAANQAAAALALGAATEAEDERFRQLREALKAVATCEDRDQASALAVNALAHDDNLIERARAIDEGGVDARRKTSAACNTAKLEGKHQGRYIGVVYGAETEVHVEFADGTRATFDNVDAAQKREISVEHVNRATGGRFVGGRMSDEEAAAIRKRMESTRAAIRDAEQKRLEVAGLEEQARSEAREAIANFAPPKKREEPPPVFRSNRSRALVLIAIAGIVVFLAARFALVAP
jgi:hypothetical protein